MTYEPESDHPVPVGWRDRSLALLDRADNRAFSGQALAIVSAIHVPEWPRTLRGTVAYFSAVACFLTLIVLIRQIPGPGWLLILPTYVFLAVLVFCVALPRRDRN